jgi:hypothetical protein
MLDGYEAAFEKILAHESSANSSQEFGTSTGGRSFERFFRATASLDVDKDDLRRYEDFVNRKVRDLLLISHGQGQRTRRHRAPGPPHYQRAPGDHPRLQGDGRGG